jgi:hypothetical protein
MKSIGVTSIVFGLVFAAALAGIFVRPILPHDLLGSEDKEVVRLTTGLLTTMSALVLGMLVSSAKSSHDARKNEVRQFRSCSESETSFLSVTSRNSASYESEVRIGGPVLKRYLVAVLSLSSSTYLLFGNDPC